MYFWLNIGSQRVQLEGEGYPRMIVIQDKFGTVASFPVRLGLTELDIEVKKYDMENTPLVIYSALNENVDDKNAFFASINADGTPVVEVDPLAAD